MHSIVVACILKSYKLFMRSFCLSTPLVLVIHMDYDWVARDCGLFIVVVHFASVLIIPKFKMMSRICNFCHFIFHMLQLKASVHRSFKVIYVVCKMVNFNKAKYYINQFYHAGFAFCVYFLTALVVSLKHIHFIVLVVPLKSSISFFTPKS